jgi:oligosaccharyltransferase complex subunit alpha (ribophorin I)
MVTFSISFMLVKTVSPLQLRVEALTVTSVERTVDIASQLVQVTHKIKLENTEKSPVKFFVFTIEPQLKAHLSFIGATTGKDSKQLTTTVGLLPEKPEALSYQVAFPSSAPLGAGSSIEVEVETVFTKYLQAFPEEITQKDKQLIKFIGNHYFYTPYKTTKQNTKVLLASRNVESFTKLKPFSQSDSTISFGPFENIAPLSYSECVVHYENNSPFLTVTKMVRTIEVSHWGNIAVEEHIDLLHTGAKLKGSFSRFDYQRETNSGINSIKAFKTLLPAAARDVYYRDDIGNISTSSMVLKMDAVELTLRPRFPLFGGWKTRYVIGYNLPSYEYLFNEGSQHVLKMRLLDHLFDTMVVDDLTVKIILPEGSTDLKLKTPYELKRLPATLHFTYLDVTGRPVTTLEGKNFVENHIQDFTLEYNFPKMYLLREPLLIIAAFLVLFFTVLVYVRLDFSIAPSKTSKSNTSSANVETVLRRHGKRAGIYETFESLLSKLKLNKDVTAFQSALKNLTSEHKAETQAINEILGKVKGEAPELADSITELQRLDRMFWEAYVNYEQLVEKLVIGKIPRQQFLDQETQFNKKRDEIAEKLNQIVKNL